MIEPINLETHVFKFWECSLKYILYNILLIVQPVLFLENMLQLVASVHILYIIIDLFCLILLSIVKR